MANDAVRPTVGGAGPEPKREWHRIEFLSPGDLKDTKVHRTVTLDHKQEPVGVHHRTEYQYGPQDSLGHGYYVVEDGKVVAQVDDQGQPLDLERIHECKVVRVLTTDPFGPLTP